MSQYNQVPERQPSNNNPVNGGQSTIVFHAPLPMGHGRDKFSRRDALIRHINSKNKKVAYQCPQCDPIRVFTRKDHLNQHLRGFHKQGNNKAANPEPQAQGQQPVPMLAAEPQEQAPAYAPHVPHRLGYPPLPFSYMEPGNSMPRQPEPAYPGTFAMMNYYGQENGYNYWQDANNQLMGIPVLGGGHYMDGAGVQGDHPQQFGNYGLAGDLFQFDGFQMNEFQMNQADGQGQEGNADFNTLE